jgi:hypothetical protein
MGAQSTDTGRRSSARRIFLLLVGTALVILLFIAASSASPVLESRQIAQRAAKAKKTVKKALGAGLKKTKTKKVKGIKQKKTTKRPARGALKPKKTKRLAVTTAKPVVETDVAPKPAPITEPVIVEPPTVLATTVAIKDAPKTTAKPVAPQPVAPNPETEDETEDEDKDDLESAPLAHGGPPIGPIVIRGCDGVADPEESTEEVISEEVLFGILGRPDRKGKCKNGQKHGKWCKVKVTRTRRRVRAYNRMQSINQGRRC